LLLRLLIGAGAILLIWYKLKDDFFDHFHSDLFHIVHYQYILMTLLLMIFNWGLEAYKWQYLMKDIEELPFFRSFQLTITGITLGIITPNRIGEIPGRILLLNNKKIFKKALFKTAIGAYSQLLVTFIFGTIATFFTIELFGLQVNYTYVKIILLLLTSLSLLSYFYPQLIRFIFYSVPYIENKKWLDALGGFSFKKRLNILLMSVLRYFVFSFQYFLMLKAFSISFSAFNELLLIPLCFMVTSVIPTILISEIGVRGSVALLIFGVITDNQLAILFASVLLWLINVAIPAVIGLFFIKQLKILTER